MGHTVTHISGLWGRLHVRQPFKEDTYSSARTLIKADHTARSDDDVTREKPNRLTVDTTAAASHIVLEWLRFSALCWNNSNWLRGQKPTEHFWLTVRILGGRNLDKNQQQKESVSYVQKQHN